MTYYILRLQSNPDSIPYEFSEKEQGVRITTRSEADERAEYWSKKKYKVEVIEVIETRTVVNTLMNVDITNPVKSKEKIDRSI